MSRHSYGGTGQASGTTGGIVNYTGATAADNCPGATADCVPASGSFFPIGNTIVTCSSTDAAANPGPTCSFNLFVKFYANLLAVDPAGGFVIYAAPMNCSNDTLVYQALDATGNPKGAPKALLSCGTIVDNIQGVDILEDGSAYWISFGGSSAASAKYLMKIDATGKTIIPPKAVVDASKFGSVSGATALEASGSKLFLFIAGSGGKIYRAKLDKGTLSLLNFRATGWVTQDNGSLQASQSGGRFLAMSQPMNVLKGFGLTSKGLSNGLSWRLSPRTDGNHSTGGVSADGLTALSNVDLPTDQLYDQPLTSTNKPVGDPSSVAMVDVISVDATNALANGSRYVVYLANENGVNHLSLQMVNATTGAKIGAPISLN